MIFKTFVTYETTVNAGETYIGKVCVDEMGMTVAMEDDVVSSAEKQVTCET